MDRISRLIIFFVSVFATSFSFAQYQFYDTTAAINPPTYGSVLEACKNTTSTQAANMVRGDRQGTTNAYRCVYQDPNGLFYSDYIYGFNCPSGQTYTNGSCSVPVVCPSSGSQVAPANTVFEAGNGLTSVVCLAGCEASASVAAKGADGKNYVWGPIIATGSSCTSGGSTAPAVSDPPQKCPVGKCPGTFNGASICVPCAQTKENTTKTSTESSTTAASGAAPGPASTSSSGSSSSTTCKDGTCTTTETTTTTAPDGTKTDKVTSKTQDQNSFCVENPNSATCKGSESAWGGSCAAFSCDGDAVQCAQARGAWELACALKVDDQDPNAVTGRNAVTAGDRPPGHPAGQADTVNFSLSSHIKTAPIFGSSGQCVSDKAVSFMGKSYTLPFSKWCPYLEAVGQGFVALAYLTAAFIVFGRRDD